MFSFRDNRRTSHPGGSAISYETGDRVQKTFPNAMVAHVWAQGTQSFGQSGNGNFFFHGRALYSYGAHFVAGYILPREGETLAQSSASSGALSVGLTLVELESNSVSTNRHVSHARQAARGEWAAVPGLTQLARALARAETNCDADSVLADVREWAITNAAYGDGTDAVARALPAILSAIGADNPERRARAAIAEAERKRKAREARAAKREHESRLRTLAAYAKGGGLYATPESIAADMEADARRVGGMTYSAIDAAREEWRDVSRDLFRAIKAGKADGRVSARVRHAQSLRRAIKESMPLFEHFDTLARRVKTWQHHKTAVRNAVALARGVEGAALDTESRYRGAGQPNATGLGMVARALTDGAESARALAAYVSRREGDTRSAWASAAARVSGFDPAALSLRLRRLSVEMESNAEAVSARDRRARARAEVSALRSALAAVGRPPEALDALAAYAETLRAGFDVAEKYAGRVPHSWERDKPTVDGLLPPYADIPGAWRCGGFTPAHFRRAARLLKAALADVRETLADAAHKRRAELESIAREAWRDGREGALPREVRNATRAALRECEDGGAMLRAEGVTRDESGAITGGTLYTSQGASVPLTHALRAFRFLRHCRQTETEWRANGHSLRVGHFRIDSVDAAGNFRAGCHSIRYAECARLAERLGVADLAPAITTESNMAEAV